MKWTSIERDVMGLRELYAKQTDFEIREQLNQILGGR